MAPWLTTGPTRWIWAVLAVTILAVAAGCDEETTGTIPVKLGDETFTLETAISRMEQAQGMMGRTEIAEDGGMIFIFDSDEERNFWMKNCLIDLDILYVDRTGRIVSSYTMKAEPPQRDDETEAEYEARMRRDGSYPSNGKARYVIEIKAGRIDELGLKDGQKLDLDLDRLKKLAEMDDGP
ncbi:MAG: DUF192 domain-containing protein [Phycisphaerales bacterium]